MDWQPIETAQGKRGPFFVLRVVPIYDKAHVVATEREVHIGFWDDLFDEPRVPSLWSCHGEKITHWRPIEFPPPPPTEQQ